MASTHLHLDPFSGIAGDMFLGAMIDVGLPLERLEAALAPLPVEHPYHLTTRRVSYHGIGATDLKVHLEDGGASHHHTHQHEHAHSHQHDHGHPHPHEHSHGHDHHHDHAHGGEHHHEHAHSHEHGHGHHHHTTAKDVLAMVDKLDTTDRGRERARRILTKLAEAEGRVHGMPVEDVHFHEVGAVDSIVDMLGAAVAVELMGVDTLSCGPLPLSTGFVRCEHGLMPVPAPATAYLLRGLPTTGTPRTGELITPTGAAIVAALCDTVGPAPDMTVREVGYGAGDRNDPDVPNLLRVMLGER